MATPNLVLELPEGLSGLALDEALNERFRLIAESFENIDTSTVATASTSGISFGAQLLLFSFSGILAVQLDVAPRISLPAATR